MTLIHDLTIRINERLSDYNICGFVAKNGTVIPLGTDTKVLSTVFELVTRETLKEIAGDYNYIFKDAETQNQYPDFTFFHKDKKHIAIDIKTTYRRNNKDKFSYTLGSYTSFMNEKTPNKNILYPFNEYVSHLVVGFVYNRVDVNTECCWRTDDISYIELPYNNIEIFVREKWEISGDKAGSGNTTNIGSITGSINDFRSGTPIFKNEEEFLEYWRNYGRTKKQRAYNNLSEYRNLKIDSLI
jgi:hypothetical protein